MKCPHCLEGFHVLWEDYNLDYDVEGLNIIYKTICPECKKYVIKLEVIDKYKRSKISLIKPKSFSRQSLPEEVSDPYAQDYKEACAVLSDSPKASAALSRRCLQSILRDIEGVKKSDLNKEIQEVINKNVLPVYLSNAVDAVRIIGNFAAHPIKSTNSGEIIDVELGEAEWLLDVLEGLFDFYFVQPKIIDKKRAELNKKLEDAGKPPLK